jgi:hypothetical protein
MCMFNYVSRLSSRPPKLGSASSHDRTHNLVRLPIIHHLSSFCKEDLYPEVLHTMTTTAPCYHPHHQHHQGAQVPERDRIPTMVFSAVLTSSTSSQPLKPSLARDFSYGDQDELTRKLNDFYWYNNHNNNAHDAAVPTANLLQQQQKRSHHAPPPTASSSYNKHKNNMYKAQTRARLLSEEMGHQMKIGVIPLLPEDVEKEETCCIISALKQQKRNHDPPLPAPAAKARPSSIVSRRLSQLFLLLCTKNKTSSNKTTCEISTRTAKTVRFAE